MTSTCSQVLVIVLFRHETDVREAGRAHRPVSGDGLRTFHPPCRNREETGEGGLEETGRAGGGSEKSEADGYLYGASLLPHPGVPGEGEGPAYPLRGHLSVPEPLRKGERHLPLWGSDEVHPPPAAGHPGAAEEFG